MLVSNYRENVKGNLRFVILDTYGFAFSSVEGGLGKDCPIDPFMINHEKSKFVDMQTLKIQETSDMVPVGELPRHMSLTADRYTYYYFFLIFVFLFSHLTNKVIPGTRVTVTGIYSISERQKVNSLFYSLFISFQGRRKSSGYPKLIYPCNRT